MFKRINFQTIPVKDQQRALEFYRDTMGLTVQTDAPYEGGLRWIFMAIPGAETMLHFGEPKDYSIRNVPALCLVTDDVDAEAARLEKAGVKFVQPVQDAPWNEHVRWAMIRDTEDNLILIQSSAMEGN